MTSELNIENQINQIEPRQEALETVAWVRRKSVNADVLTKDEVCGNLLNNSIAVVGEAMNGDRVLGIEFPHVQSDNLQTRLHVRNVTESFYERYLSAAVDEALLTQEEADRSRDKYGFELNLSRLKASTGRGKEEYHGMTVRSGRTLVTSAHQVEVEARNRNSKKVLAVGGLILLTTVITACMDSSDIKTQPKPTEPLPDPGIGVTPGETVEAEPTQIATPTTETITTQEVFPGASDSSFLAVPGAPEGFGGTGEISELVNNQQIQDNLNSQGYAPVVNGGGVLSRTQSQDGSEVCNSNLPDKLHNPDVPSEEDTRIASESGIVSYGDSETGETRVKTIGVVSTAELPDEWDCINAVVTDESNQAGLGALRTLIIDNEGNIKAEMPAAFSGEDSLEIRWENSGPTLYVNGNAVYFTFREGVQPTEVEPTPTPVPTLTNEPIATVELAQEWWKIDYIGMDNLPQSWRWELHSENAPKEDGKVIVFTAKPKYDLAAVEKIQMTPEITRFVFGFLSNGEKIKVRVDSVACEFKSANGLTGRSGVINSVEVGGLVSIWLFGLEEEANIDELEWSKGCKDVWRELRPNENLKDNLAGLFSKGLIPEGWQGEDGVIDLTDKVSLASTRGK